MKILVIDDDPFMGKLLVRQLAQLVCGEVLAYERARDALACIQADVGAVGLVLCDLHMPEMDGVQVIRHLVRTGYTGGLVLVSGEDERLLQTVQRLAGAHDLKVLGALRKPVSLDQLRSVLDRSGAAQPAARRGAGGRCYGAAALRQAISAGELVNHYQPKVDLVTARVTGVEALVRWMHPEHGLVLPDEFIPVAEDNRLIDDLTRVVLQTALQDTRRWKDAGLALRVAVNVSMENLGRLDFPEVVEQALADAGLVPNTLILEVTESRLMADPLTRVDILTRLRLKRIGLSIDDFGTGHSSLAHVRDIPFNELKVDRGFVHGACRDASLRSILQASLGMARQLGIKTVAEGVEDRDDWDFLRLSGCDLAQGWFIARPMPAARIPEWMQEWAQRGVDLTPRLSSLAPMDGGRNPNPAGDGAGAEPA